MDKPFIKALRKVFGQTSDTYGMRLGVRHSVISTWRMLSFIAFAENELSNSQQALHLQKRQPFENKCQILSGDLPAISTLRGTMELQAR